MDPLVSENLRALLREALDAGGRGRSSKPVRRSSLCSANLRWQAFSCPGARGLNAARGTRGRTGNANNYEDIHPLERLVAGGVERGIHLLAISCDHAYRLEHLPFHHRDPFDRLLVVQASHESMQLVSRDATLDAYPAIRVWDRVYEKLP